MFCASINLPAVKDPPPALINKALPPVIAPTARCIAVPVVTDAALTYKVEDDPEPVELLGSHVRAVLEVILVVSKYVIPLFV